MSHDQETKSPSAVEAVQIDGLALLKIIKHCKESSPANVTGSLLGLNVEGRLEVTNCFPFPTSGDSKDNDDYQIQMMKYLREVNVDNNTVGWYQSSFMGSFINDSVLELLKTFHESIPGSVTIVFDPFSTKNGKLSLKAFKMTDKFLEVYASRDFTIENLAERTIQYEDVLEEIPVKVHNSSLVHAFLYELRGDKKLSCGFDRLNLTSRSFLLRNLQDLSGVIDQFSNEQNRIQTQQRTVLKQKLTQQQYLTRFRAENAARRAQGLPEKPESQLADLDLFKDFAKPNFLEEYLLSKQINYHCDLVNSLSTQTVNKMFVLESLQPTKPKH